MPNFGLESQNIGQAQSKHAQFWSGKSKPKSSTVETYPMLVGKVETWVEHNRNMPNFGRESRNISRAHAQFRFRKSKHKSSTCPVLVWKVKI